MKRITLLLMVCALLFLCACSSDDSPASSAVPTPAEAGLTPGNSGDVADSGGTADPGSSSESENAPPKPLGLTANSSAYDKYMDVMKTMSASSDNDEQIDMDFTMVMDMDMSFMGESMSETMEMSGNIKVITESGRVQYAAVMDMGDIIGTGSSSVMEMYYDGVNSYYAIDGVQIDIDDNDILNQITSATDVPDFPESAIISSDTRTVGGNEETTIIVNGRELSDYILDAAGEELAELGTSADISVDDVKIVVVSAPDGTPVSLELEMAMYMSIVEIESGVEITISVVITMEYFINAYGSGVVIDFPH